MSRGADLLEPARRTPRIGGFDAIVCGGGPAGLAAAHAAARGGARTLLVERYGFLGGMGTAAGVTNFCGLHANVAGEIRRVVHGAADALTDRIAALGGLNAPHSIFGGRIAAQAYDTAAFKCAADAMLADAGATTLFHAWICGVAMRDARRVEAVLVETKSGRFALAAQAFIDATGDGDVAQAAGCAMASSAAGPEGLLYPSTMFRVAGVDAEAAGDAWLAIPRLMEEAEREVGWRFPRRGAIVRPQKHAAEWRVNVTQVRNADGRAVDGTDAWQLSAGEVEGRRQAAEFARFLRERVPGFRDSYVVDLAPQLGIRETRRLVGRYVLTEDDVLACRDFDDAIGVNAWPLEQHVAGDVRWRFFPDGSRGYNHLPYRMLLPVEVDNLWVAGRCASMTHDAQSAARVSGGCLAMGQAAGAAAALAVRDGASNGDVALPRLRAALRAEGAFLGG